MRVVARCTQFEYTAAGVGQPSASPLSDMLRQGQQSKVEQVTEELDACKAENKRLLDQLVNSTAQLSTTSAPSRQGADVGPPTSDVNYELAYEAEKASAENGQLKAALESLKSGRANSSTDAEYQRQIAELSAKLKTVESEVEELKRQLAAQQRDTDRQNSNAKLQTLEVLPAQYWSPLTAAAVCV